MAIPPKKKPVPAQGKKPGLAIGIMVKPKPNPKDDLPSLSGPDEQDEPDQDELGGGDQEPDGDETPGQCDPDPEAVCFRSEAETCGHCDYMQGNRCSHPIVAMPVQPGDGCNAFRPKQDEGDQSLGQGQPPAGPGQGPAPGAGQVEEQS